MKKILLLIIILSGTIISYAQSKNIVGAWLWRDSKTSISIFIKEDGIIKKHIAPINEPISDKNLKHGTYKLKANQLFITWSDNSTETNNIKLVDNFTLQIKLKDSKTNTNKTYVFKKVIDEEVIEN